MTVKKTQQTLSTTLEKTEQSLNGLETALDNNVGGSLLATSENSGANENNTGLPEGWCDVNLSELVKESFTGLVRGAKDQDQSLEYPYLKMNNLSINGEFEADNLVRVSATQQEVDRFTLRRGDFIFNTRNSAELVGKCGVFKVSGSEPILFNNNLLNIRFSDGVLAEIVANWFRSSLGRRDLELATSATTSVAAIYQKSLFKLQIPLPPLAEQTVIAQTLDTLLAQVDNIKTRLDAIPKILKTFRQSVLAAAVSGKLTESWRGENECEQVDQLITECASKILDQKSLKFADKAFRDDEIKHSLPEGWAWVRLAKIAEVVSGVAKGSKTKEETVQLPYLRVANVQRGYLNLTEIKEISVPRSKSEKLILSKGDILFNEGGDIDKLGRGWIWEGQLENCIHQNHVFRARCYSSRIQPKYISHFGNTEGKEYFLREGTQSVNLANINKTTLSLLPVPLPPSEEQTEIVRRVEELFAFADQIEQQVKNAQGRVNNLTQSILAKAFRGELTAQWRAKNPDLISGENSAEALLAKIQAERDALKKSSKPKKKSTAKKASVKKTISKTEN